MLRWWARAMVMGGLAWMTATGAGAETRARVRLLPVVRVNAAWVTLADLLPAASPPGLRLRAERIALGAAPLAGSSRQLSREEIARRMGPVLATEIEIPPCVVVERRTRELSREEVLAVIRAALRKRGFANAAELGLADVRLEMPVLVTEANPGLRVVGMSFDPALRLAVFRLWTAKEPDLLPFDLMVRPVAGLEGWLRNANGGARPALGRRGLTPRTVLAQRIRRPRGKPLVMALRTARLVLVSGTMEIQTTAEALEPGYLGETIRVRMTKTRQVVRAMVVGTECLEKRF